MDYGKPAFTENQTIIGNPEVDPIQWNTSVGLQAFAESVQLEFSQVNRKLDEIIRLLRSHG